MSTLDYWSEDALSEQALKEMHSTIKELLKWTKFAGMQQLRSILEQNLKTDTEKLVYELSDGNRSTRDIAGQVGLGSKTTISGYWDKWTKLGVVQESVAHEGRYEHVCSLTEVGIEVPNLPKVVGQAPTKETSEDKPKEGEN